jgi:hypothetical protein
MRSTDGTCNRIFFFRDGFLTFFFLLDVPQNPVVNPSGPYTWNTINTPWVGGAVGVDNFAVPGSWALNGPNYWLGSSSTASNWFDFYNLTTTMGAGVQISTAMSYMGAGVSSGAIVVNQGTSGEQVWMNEQLIRGYGMWPVGLVGITAGGRGYNGNLFDMWSSALMGANGDTYNATSKKFVRLGQFIFPWNNTQPQILAV